MNRGNWRLDHHDNEAVTRYAQHLDLRRGAGNWLNATADSKWVYNADNEIAGRLPTASPGVTNITVTG